ncbi:MAG: hypothetical protein JKY37_25405 [Nannocystaceae bacterium]|nr:hypothetical protein [Nannocystaceae bacterium]
MPGLREILSETLIFRAAQGIGKDLYASALTPGTAIAQAAPRPTDSDDEDVLRDNNIWEFASNAPDTFTDCRLKKRHADRYMGHLHTVFDKIKFDGLRVTTRSGHKVSLPLSDKFLACFFTLDDGKVDEADLKGYWQLPHRVDRARMYVFGYELRDGSLVPITKDEMDKLGEDLMPSRDLAAGLAVMLLPGTTVKVQLAAPRFVVCVGVTCCKEKNDWEPGELLGAARLFPHTMVVSNVDLDRVESSLLCVRPPRSMVHDPEMQADVRAILFTDTNDDRSVGLKPGPPLPIWDNIFDYYELDAANAFAGIPLKFVDRDRGERVITGGIRRASRAAFAKTESDFYQSGDNPFRKMAGQGEFDNLHLAPRMKFTHPLKQSTVLHGSITVGKREFTDIVMAPFCVHDCLHMHTRWGVAGDGLTAPANPKPMKGFVGYKPYAQDAAPMVPFDQDVYVSVNANHEFAYRAVARGDQHIGMRSPAAR